MDSPAPIVFEGRTGNNSDYYNIELEADHKYSFNISRQNTVSWGQYLFRLYSGSSTDLDSIVGAAQPDARHGSYGSNFTYTPDESDVFNLRIHGYSSYVAWVNVVDDPELNDGNASFVISKI